MNIRQIYESSEWRQVRLVPTGGLTEVGFSSDESCLLVVSHTGRGVISTANGERLARDYDIPCSESQWIQEDKKLVQGIGPVAEAWIPVVGLWGGQLAPTNPKKWAVCIELEGNGENAYIRNQESQQLFLVDAPVTKIRAFGFSKSGRFLALATSSDIAIFEHLGF